MILKGDHFWEEGMEVPLFFPWNTTLDILYKTNKTGKWREGSLSGDLGTQGVTGAKFPEFSFGFTYPKLGAGEADQK